MRTEITAGQTSDYLGFDLVMADNLPEPSVLLADRGYDSDNIRKTMEVRDVVPVIPMRKTRKLRVAVDRRLYRLRNLVERCFNKLKHFRRVATRFDKLARNFLAAVLLAWLPDADITSRAAWTAVGVTLAKTALTTAAQQAFSSGLNTAAIVSAAIAALTAIIAGRKQQPEHELHRAAGLRQDHDRPGHRGADSGDRRLAVGVLPTASTAPDRDREPLR